MSTGNIDFATLLPGGLHTSYGTINSSTTITPDIDGFLIGKSVIFKTQAAASGGCYVTDENGAVLAGIPYAEVAKGPNDANLQVAWTIPVTKGITYSLTINGDGNFQNVGLRELRS